jgi:hypothetical protein
MANYSGYVVTPISPLSGTLGLGTLVTLDFDGNVYSIPTPIAGTRQLGTLQGLDWSGILYTPPTPIAGSHSLGTQLFLNHQGKRFDVVIGEPSTTGTNPGVIVVLTDHDMPEGTKSISSTGSTVLSVEIFAGTYAEGTKSISGDGTSALSHETVSWQEGTKQISGDGATALSYEGWTYSEGTKSISATGIVALHREFIRYTGFPPRRNSDYDASLMWDEDTSEWVTSNTSGAGRYRTNLIVIGYAAGGVGVIYIG